MTETDRIHSSKYGDSSLEFARSCTDIHRAPLGTHERFIGFLIEHYAGNFPLCLTPSRSASSRSATKRPLLDYSRAILDELRSHQVCAQLDASTDHIKTKIANAEQMKVHTMLVILARTKAWRGESGFA